MRRSQKKECRREGRAFKSNMLIMSVCSHAVYIFYKVPGMFDSDSSGMFMGNVLLIKHDEAKETKEPDISFGIWSRAVLKLKLDSFLN